MDSVRILHCADFHLGVERMSLGNKSKARRTEARRTFHAVADLAVSEKAALVLVAGDIFDYVNVPEEILCEVRDTFAALAPVKVAVVSGNHDPATTDSVYMRKNFWPDNVILFNSDLAVKEIPELGVRLVGAGFTGPYCSFPQLRRLNLPEDDYINIGIMHGDLVADGAGSDYNPIPARLIEASGLNYLALGHRHTRLEPQRLGITTFAYSGCPEGQRFGENGDKGVYIADVTKTGCEVRFVRTCIRRYTEIEADITDVKNLKEAAGRIRECMQAENGADFAEDIYRVKLVGTPDRDFVGDFSELAEEMPDIWYVEAKDRTEPAVNEEDYLEENSLRGVFVKHMNSLKGSVNEDRRKLALKLGLEAFKGELKIGE